MVALYSGQFISIFGVIKCYTSTNSIVIFHNHVINYITKELVLVQHISPIPIPPKNAGIGPIPIQIPELVRP